MGKLFDVDIDIVKEVFNRGETHADMSKVYEDANKPIESFDDASIYEYIMPHEKF